MTSSPSTDPTHSPRKRPQAPGRKWGSVALIAVACASGATSSHAAGGRLICRLPDGEQHVVRRELVESFGLSVSNCKPMPPGPSVEPEPVLQVALQADASWPKQIESGVSAGAAVRDADSIPADVAVNVDVSVTVINAPKVRPASSWAPIEYQGLIARSARSHGVDPQMVEAVIYVESHFEPNARSNKGALGLMQLMPGTALQCGVQKRSSLFDPAINIDCGTRYLGELTAYFAGRIDLALAAYNAGPGAVVRHGWRVPPFAETRAYVDRVLQRFNASR